MHSELANQIRDLLMEAPGSRLSAQQIGEVDSCDNASEFELWGDDGNCYLVTVAESE